MKKSVFKKISVLMFSAAFVKALGFIFRIYLSGVAGAEGCGLYQLILSVYSFGASISSFGISQTMSRLVAYNVKYSKRILRTALLITGAVSFIVFIVTFFGSEYIAFNILKDSRLVLPVKAIAVCFPAIGVFSATAGYFNGLTKVKYAAKGQIFEQLTRILFVLVFAKSAFENGLENGILFMSFGIVLGEFVSTAYIFSSYLVFSKTKKEGYEKKHFLGDILKMSVPLAMGGYISSFIHTLENILLPEKLSLSGLLRRESLSVLGIVKGMAAPILFFPVTVVSAVSTLALPEISRADSLKNRKRIKSLALRVLLSGFFTGLLTVALIFLYSEKITLLIYRNTEVSFYIKALSPALPFLYFNISATAVLNGLGKHLYTAAENILTGLLKLAFTMLIVPKLGINGYFLGFTLSEIPGFIFFSVLIFNTIFAKSINKL